MRRLFALAVVVACAASCEVRSDLVFPPGGTGGADGSGGSVGEPDAAIVPPEASPSGGSPAHVDAAEASLPDATPTDATSRDAASLDGSSRDAGPDAKADAWVGECRDDDDCPFYDPRCDPQSRTCVDCLDNGDCDGNDDICDPLLLRCVECVFDADCSDRDQPLCRDSECSSR